VTYHFIIFLWKANGIGTFEVKIANFGTSSSSSEEENSLGIQGGRNLLTLAPEQNYETKGYTEKSETYSFGLCLWSIITCLDLTNSCYWTMEWYCYEELAEIKKLGAIPKIQNLIPDIKDDKLKYILTDCLQLQPESRCNLATAIATLSQCHDISV